MRGVGCMGRSSQGHREGAVRRREIPGVYRPALRPRFRQNPNRSVRPRRGIGISWEKSRRFGGAPHPRTLTLDTRSPMILIQYGERGPRVTLLQILLNRNGADPVLDVDG